MTSLILVLALAQSHVYRWEDSHGTVHFSANPSERPKGTPIEVFELGPIEKNGLMPDPEPVVGPFTRSQWRAKFAEIVGRRAELRAANGLTTRRCNPRTVEVTAPGQGPTQTQMFIHDCPLSVQCSKARDMYSSAVQLRPKAADQSGV